MPNRTCRRRGNGVVPAVRYRCEAGGTQCACLLSNCPIELKWTSGVPHLPSISGACVAVPVASLQLKKFHSSKEGCVAPARCGGGPSRGSTQVWRLPPAPLTQEMGQ